jgi:hypothetical protein
MRDFFEIVDGLGAWLFRRWPLSLSVEPSSLDGYGRRGGAVVVGHLGGAVPVRGAVCVSKARLRNVSRRFLGGFGPHTLRAEDGFSNRPLHEKKGENYKPAYRDQVSPGGCHTKLQSKK